jgi:hypothetical protein
VDLTISITERLDVAGHADPAGGRSIVASTEDSSATLLVVASTEDSTASPVVASTEDSEVGALRGVAPAGLDADAAERQLSPLD